MEETTSKKELESELLVSMYELLLQTLAILMNWVKISALVLGVFWFKISLTTQKLVWKRKNHSITTCAVTHCKGHTN